VYTL